jgi:MYXO-CTERM domain-containing protein
MGIVNKRNAVLGWAVLKLGKRTAKRKAKGVVPSPPEGAAPKAGVAAGVAALAGVVAFLRRRRSSDA